MFQSLPSIAPLLLTVILVTLAIGLPVVFVLVIRFLSDRNLNLGRSKELEKLIWQLHRIATAMEHQMRLSFPAVQPGTEESHDLAYLQQIPQPKPSAPAVATPHAAAPPAAAAQPIIPPVESKSHAPPPPPPPLEPPSGEVTRHGVNSMFGL